MKGIKGLLALFLLLILLAGCSDPARDLSQQILPPSNSSISIHGTWKVVEVLHQQEESEGEWLGEIVQFSPQLAQVGEEVLTAPRYQIKRVNTADYLLYQSNNMPQEFPFTSEQIEVITITNEELFYCEVLKENNENIVLKIYQDLLLLEKVSDEVTIEPCEEALEAEGNEKEEELLQREKLRSGVLIGLRTDQEDPATGEPVFSYRTLWISNNERILNPIQQVDHLIFPRRSGFWKLEVKRLANLGKAEDLLYAHNFASKEEPLFIDAQEEMALMQRESEALTTRKIVYLGNDYVSVEEVSTGVTWNGKPWEESRLKMIPIDTLPSTRGVSIVDLLGQPGLEAMESGFQRKLGESGGQDIQWEALRGDSFGLERRLGHWFFKGRINSVGQEALQVLDYPINVIPPAKVIFYDELKVPWTDLKDRVPSATDFFTSPNQDMAIAITQKELLIYEIQQGYLARDPLARVPLNLEESVVMAEWATGSYVDNWDRTITGHLQVLNE